MHVPMIVKITVHFGARWPSEVSRSTLRPLCLQRKISESFD